MNLMFVQKQIFLVTVSHHLKFTTINHVMKKTTGFVLQELKKVVNLYKRRGFEVKHLHSDPEFNPLESDIVELGLTYNEVAASEHVLEVEHQIRVIKEHICCAWSKLPYDLKPKLMVITLAKMVVLWLNNFPPTTGVSDVLSLP